MDVVNMTKQPFVRAIVIQEDPSFEFVESAAALVQDYTKDKKDTLFPYGLDLKTRKSPKVSCHMVRE